MSAVVIQDFRYGLDTRRSALTSILGTLVTLENAHVNQGGEIEKRKAFVRIDITEDKPEAVTILAIQPVKDSIVILGSGSNAPGTWPASLGDNPLFTYQELARPDSLGGFGALGVASVVHSKTHAGKVFALCKMSDDTYNAFYDGEFIPDINVLGVVLDSSDFFGYIEDQINGGEGYTASTIVNGIDITGEPGRKFSVSLGKTGTWGADPAATFISDGTAPVPGRKASGYFTIEDGVYRPVGSAHKISSVAIRIHDNTGAVVSTTELLNGGTAVVFGVSAEATATAVVASINANKATSGYEARNTGNIVAIFATTNGTAANTGQIRVTTAGFVMIGKCSIGFAGTAFDLEYIKADGVDILTAGPLTFPTASETLAVFVSRVVADINTGTSAGLTHGYVAMSRGNVLKISKKLTLSYPDPVVGTDALPNEVRLIKVEAEVTTTGTDTGVITEGDATGLIVQIEPNPVEITYVNNPALRVQPWSIQASPFRAMVVGGRPPYTYYWTIIYESDARGNLAFTSQGGSIGNSANTELTYLTDWLPRDPSSYSAKVQLDVKDSTGVEVTKYAQILFRIKRGSF